MEFWRCEWIESMIVVFWIWYNLSDLMFRSFIHPSISQSVDQTNDSYNNCRCPRLFCHVKIDRLVYERKHSFPSQQNIIITFEILNRKWKFSLMNQMIQQKKSSYKSVLHKFTSLISQDILLPLFSVPWKTTLSSRRDRQGVLENLCNEEITATIKTRRGSLSKKVQMNVTWLHAINSDQPCFKLLITVVWI